LRRRAPRSLGRRLGRSAGAGGQSRRRVAPVDLLLLDQLRYLDDAATLRVGTGGLLARQGNVELHLLIAVGTGGADGLRLLDRGWRLDLVGQHRHGQVLGVAGRLRRRHGGGIIRRGALGATRRLLRSRSRGGQGLLAGRAGGLLARELVLDAEHLLTLRVGALESDRHDYPPVIVIPGKWRSQNCTALAPRCATAGQVGNLPHGAGGSPAMTLTD